VDCTAEVSDRLGTRGRVCQKLCKGGRVVGFDAGEDCVDETRRSRSESRLSCIEANPLSVDNFTTICVSKRNND
jgi:hypothetical protein